MEAYIKSHRLDELILTIQGIEGLKALTVIEARGTVAAELTGVVTCEQVRKVKSSAPMRWRT